MNQILSTSMPTDNKKQKNKIRNSNPTSISSILKFFAIAMLIFGILLKINKAEWIICIALFGLVISMELINTAIENTVDLITKEKNEQAKIAKDVAAGAVLVSAIVAAIIGLMIFVPKISLIY